jgi:hypothetical protein
MKLASVGSLDCITIIETHVIEEILPRPSLVDDCFVSDETINTDRDVVFRTDDSIRTIFVFVEPRLGSWSRDQMLADSVVKIVQGSRDR